MIDGIPKPAPLFLPKGHYWRYFKLWNFFFNTTKWDDDHNISWHVLLRWRLKLKPTRTKMRMMRGHLTSLFHLARQEQLDATDAKERLQRFAGKQKKDSEAPNPPATSQHLDEIIVSEIFRVDLGLSENRVPIPFTLSLFNIAMENGWTWPIYRWFTY